MYGSLGARILPQDFLRKRDGHSVITSYSIHYTKLYENFNSPGQVVIAGQKDAVERAGALCKEAGAKRALPLPVSVPSHCALMKPAAERLAIALAEIEFNTPQIPVINNVDVVAETDPAKIKDALVRQLYSPVRWTEGVEKMNDLGVEKSYNFV